MDFPEPEGGRMKLAPPAQGETQARIPRMTAEQRAHHVFWADGTRERVDELIKDGRGAGLRQTLRWLLGMRIREAYEQTGWRYKLVIYSEKAHWEEYEKAKTA